jgi:SWI/SNF-related matrix-associated actin-dependent regulator 1 of chromatin subfamily A
MRVVFTDGLFICKCSYENRGLPKAAGFRWHNEHSLWYTTNHGVASRLESYLDDSAKIEISKKRLVKNTFTGRLSVPPTEKLLPFQEEAAKFALSRNRSYLALDPGLGKTPIAAVIAQTLFEEESQCFFYLCPPFLARNTEAEFQKWAPKLITKRFDSKNTTVESHVFDVLIIPDSVINREEIQAFIQFMTYSLKKAGAELTLFVDEAHRFKNGVAGRTKALFGSSERKGIADHFDKIVYLSGTPMPNRPIELFSVLNHSAPQTIHNMSLFDYGRRYCSGFQNQWGWDFSGASHLKELVSQVIGTFMLRYKKADVLKDLPLKTEEMVIIGDKLTPRLTRLDSAILKKFSPEDLMKGQIETKLDTETLHLMTYRKELGIAKVQAAAEFIKYYLEETDENLLVFAIHKEVIASLEKALSKWSPLVITGSTRMELRHALVQKFQTDQKSRLFIGNIQAAGTGLTLTKASRVIFAEFSWVPADNDQASDRAHRIGQQDNVFVQYLVYKNSVDKAVIETILRKKRVTEQL